MTAWLIISFFSGAVGYKVWRAAWKAWAHKVSLPHAFVDEFHPPITERNITGKPRRPKVTEVP